MFNNVNWQTVGPYAAAAAQAQATNMYAQAQQAGQAGQTGLPMMPAMGLGVNQGMQQQQMYQWYYSWQQQQQMQQPPGMMPQAVVSMAVDSAVVTLQCGTVCN